MMYICQVYLNETMETTMVGVFSTLARAMAAGAFFIQQNVENAEWIDWDHDMLHNNFTDWYLGSHGANATRIITGIQLDVPMI